MAQASEQTAMDDGDGGFMGWSRLGHTVLRSGWWQGNLHSHVYRELKKKNVLKMRRSASRMQYSRDLMKAAFANNNHDI